jgi:signal transduction histidine kinase
MWRLSAALVLPSLLAGLALGWALSLRARTLVRRLQSPEDGVRLPGKDEFAAIAGQAQDLLDKLASQRVQGERLSEAKLRQARDLALGVAHELRNPMAGLSLMADLFERRRKEGAGEAELGELAARLQTEVGRIEATVARFLEFSAAPELSLETLQLRPLLEQGIQGLLPLPSLSGDAFAWGDKKALLTILGVLFSNAAESAGPKGKISAQLSAAAGTGQALLRVWDSGLQVPEEDRARIFSPFFTTKPKGLGLGLATAASLADHLGGRLSLLEDGKTFELALASDPSAPSTI